MAHQIEGNKAFFLSTPAWHGLGTVLTDAPTPEDAWRLAYPHTLFELPLKAALEQGSETLYTDVSTHKAIVRDDGRVLGVVGSKYELYQPAEAFKFFEPWLETGGVTLEAGGSLCEGSRMWALARLNSADTDIATNDTIRGYFLVYTSFDGSLSHGLQFTSIRVVCANTLAQAISGKTASNTRRVRHTSGMRRTLDQIRESINLTEQAFHQDALAYSTLAKKRMSRPDQCAYVRHVIQEGKDDSENSARMENKVQQVLSLIDNQRNAELVPAIRGTAWEAYNAVSEYVTHEYGRNADNRVNAQWFGDSAKLNQRAFDAAYAYAN